MAKTPQDTEITLGTGRMLAIFFGLVLVCAFFFAIGFSLGRKTAITGPGSLLGSRIDSPATVVRPSAAKNDGGQAAPKSGDFGFYKAVGEKNADAALTPRELKTQTDGSAPTNSTPVTSTSSSGGDAASKTPEDGATAASATGGYYVQVAAVTRKEDAEALVEALKKKQYPAFSANNPAADKFYRVQVGPYPELKDAEAMRARLISDGYNPIVKK